MRSVRASVPFAPVEDAPGVSISDWPTLPDKPTPGCVYLAQLDDDEAPVEVIMSADRSFFNIFRPEGEGVQAADVLRSVGALQDLYDSYKGWVVTSVPPSRVRLVASYRPFQMLTLAAFRKDAWWLQPDRSQEFVRGIIIANPEEREPSWWTRTFLPNRAVRGVTLDEGTEHYTALQAVYDFALATVRGGGPALNTHQLMWEAAQSPTAAMRLWTELERLRYSVLVNQQTANTVAVEVARVTDEPGGSYLLATLVDDINHETVAQREALEVLRRYTKSPTS